LVVNGTKLKKKVVAGRILGDQVEIDGLAEGDSVIITGQINLQDGSPVEIIK
jgi:hypothetical protein